MSGYDFETIELKWQRIWSERRVFVTSDNSSTPKYYVLVEFPYPSGEGLHIGHPRSYVALDIIARKRRMEGYNVLYPMGWDAFGLPAENYAIKTGKHPRDITRRNIANFKRVMDRLGLSFDWSREIDTTDPQYYRWTQWVFLKMWERGLAYKAEVPVNWCESCKVGLANEEVIDGKCERCGTAVMPKKKEQWMLRITAYAERLLKDLDTVDYQSRIKTQQVNWIGRSEGAEIDFPILSPGNLEITAFTTRPDTIYGVTYLVLSPEHELVTSLLPFCQNQDEVHDYTNRAHRESLTDYDDVVKEPDGIQLKGVIARNPASNRDISVWLSDYVLSSYGTGAVMGVPAHDDRDWRFAQKYKLPVIGVVAGGDISSRAFTNIDKGTMINSGPLDGLSTGRAIEKIKVIMEREGYGRPSVRYKLRDWVFSRQRFWGEPIPMVFCHACGWVPVPESELPVQLPEVEYYQSSATGESPLAIMEDWVNTPCPRCRGPGKRETDTMPQWAGSSWYFLRYCDPHNDRALASRQKLDYWLPVDWYNGGMEHTTLHLLYSRFWHKFLYDIGVVPTSEPYRKRTSHGMVLGENGEKMSKSRGNVVNPNNVIREYGADALRLFEVFMGEFDQPIPWSTHGLVGMARFLQRIWNMQDKVAVKEPENETIHLVYRTTKDVAERIEMMKFNTALAALMEMINHFSRIPEIDIKHWEIFLSLLSPFAPHISEELWERLGKTDLLCSQPWPVYDHSHITKETLDIPIQVDGRLRRRLNMPLDATDKEIESQALLAVAAYIQSRSIRRIIIARKGSSMITNIVTQA
jgi:leucyl-tRNA synthetase